MIASIALIGQQPLPIAVQELSLAAVPAYGIGRRVLSSRASLVAAALAVTVPSMLYTGTLMTENAFYPVFLVCVLALVCGPKVSVVATAV